MTWYNIGVRAAEPPTAFTVMDSTVADILVKGDFQATEVEFQAVTPTGKQALQDAGGGFACIGITVRKSSAGDYIERFRELGCKVEGES